MVAGFPAVFPARGALRALRWLFACAIAACAASAANSAATDLSSERAEVQSWRQQRLDSLTSDTGWLTLTGLFWLKEGANTFGRGAGNALVLDNPALPDTAGTFQLEDGKVRFLAAGDSAVTHEGHAVREIELQSDAQGQPTVLASGPLRFFVIERAGHIGVRVRDLSTPHRLAFHGLSYFPVSTDWVFDAHFERYTPARHIRIINILGMEDDALSPGAVVFTHNGHAYRLDTVLEQPDDQELFVMFADATSGHETYGGGRFLYIPLPHDDSVRLDFNRAFNPPCALNDFATCPLPPPQNRLNLRVEAGEKAYAGGPTHHS